MITKSYSDDIDEDASTLQPFDQFGQRQVNNALCSGGDDGKSSTRFCRSDAGDIDEADKFYKKAADMRELYKPLLAHIIKETLGNANMSHEVLNNLLQRSDIFKELFAMHISIENNDRAGQMSAVYNLLTYVGKAR